MWFCTFAFPRTANGLFLLRWPVMTLVLWQLFLNAIPIRSGAQPPGACSHLYDQTTEHMRLDTLRAQWGGHKQLLPAYELPALIALSHYPELSNAHIRFREKKAKLPYASRPTLGSLLWPFGHRKYRVIISTRSTRLREPTLMHHLGFNAQIGALGHELAHIAHYEGTRRGAILWEGLRYHNLRFRERYEKQTDRIAIAHCLGLPLYEWNTFIWPVKSQDGARGRVYYAPEAIFDILWSQEK